MRWIWRCLEKTTQIGSQLTVSGSVISETKTMCQEEILLWFTIAHRAQEKRWRTQTSLRSVIVFKCYIANIFFRCHDFNQFQQKVHTLVLIFHQSKTMSLLHRQNSIRHDTLICCYFNVGPPPSTLAQHQNTIVPTPRIYGDMTIGLKYREWNLLQAE